MPSTLSTLFPSIFLQYEHHRDANGTAANILEAHNNPGETPRNKHNYESLQLLSQWWQSLTPPAQHKMKPHLLAVSNAGRLNANNLPVSELLRFISIVKDVLLRQIQLTSTTSLDLVRAFTASVVIVTALDHLLKTYPKNPAVSTLDTELQKSLSALLGKKDHKALIAQVEIANHLAPIQKGDRLEEFKTGDLDKCGVQFTQHDDDAKRDLTATSIETFFAVLQTYINTQHSALSPSRENIKSAIKNALRKQLQLPNDAYNIKDALTGTPLELPAISKPDDGLDLEEQILDYGNCAHAFVNVVTTQQQNNKPSVDDDGDGEDDVIATNQGNYNSIVNRRNCFAISSAVIDRNAGDIERVAMQRISYFGAKHIARLVARSTITTDAELVEELPILVEQVRQEVLTKTYRYCAASALSPKSRVSTCVTRLFTHAADSTTTIAVTANIGDNMVIAWIPDKQKVIYLAKPKTTTTGEAQSLHIENNRDTLQISCVELPTHSIILQLSPDVWRGLKATPHAIPEKRNQEWTIDESELLCLFEDVDTQNMQELVYAFSDKLLPADATQSATHTVNARLAIMAPPQEQVLLDQFVQQQELVDNKVARHKHPYQIVKHWAAEPPKNNRLLACIATIDADRTLNDDDKKLAALIQKYIPKLNTWFGAADAKSVLENIYTSQGFYAAPLQAQIPHSIWSSVLTAEITRLVNNDASTLQRKYISFIANLADELFRRYWSAAEDEFCNNNPDLMRNFFQIDYTDLPGLDEQHTFLKALCAYHRTLRQAAAAPNTSKNLYQVLALQLKPLNSLAYPPAVLLCSEIDKLTDGMVYQGVTIASRSNLLRDLIHSDLTTRTDGQYVWATGLVLLAQLTESETAQQEVFFHPTWGDVIPVPFRRFKILFARQQDLISDLPASHPDTQRLTDQSHAAIIRELVKLQGVLVRGDDPYFKFLEGPATLAGHFAHIFCNPDYAYANQIAITLALRAIELHDHLGWFVLAYVINHFYHEQQALFTVYQDIVTFLTALDGSTNTSGHDYFVRGLTYELLEADAESALESYRVGAAKGSAEAMTRYAAVMHNETTLRPPYHPQEQTTIIFENLKSAVKKHYPLASFQTALFFQETPDSKLLGLCSPSTSLDPDARIQCLKLESGDDEATHLLRAEYFCPVTDLRIVAESRKRQDGADAVDQQDAAGQDANDHNDWNAVANR